MGRASMGAHFIGTIENLYRNAYLCANDGPPPCKYKYVYRGNPDYVDRPWGNTRYRWGYTEHERSCDMRVAYRHPEFPWIVAFHRFFYFITQSSNGRYGALHLPAGHCTRAVCHLHRWGGYRDCVDVDLLPDSKPVPETRRGMYGYRPDEPDSFIKTDHCQYPAGSYDLSASEGSSCVNGVAQPAGSETCFAIPPAGQLNSKGQTAEQALTACQNRCSNSITLMRPIIGHDPLQFTNGSFRIEPMHRSTWCRSHRHRRSPSQASRTSPGASSTVRGIASRTSRLVPQSAYGLREIRSVPWRRRGMSSRTIQETRSSIRPATGRHRQGRQDRRQWRRRLLSRRGRWQNGVLAIDAYHATTPSPPPIPRDRPGSSLADKCSMCIRPRSRRTSRHRRRRILNLPHHHSRRRRRRRGHHHHRRRHRHRNRRRARRRARVRPHATPALGCRPSPPRTCQCAVLPAGPCKRLCMRQGGSAWSPASS